MISVRIYLTGGTVTEQWDGVSVGSCKGGSELQAGSSTTSLLEDPAVQITRGSRPNLKHIIEGEADLTDGRMSVTGLSFPLPTYPFALLITTSTSSMRFSIYRRRRQGRPRIFNRRPIQHHEGRSQHYPQYRSVWLRLRPSILGRLYPLLTPDADSRFLLLYAY